MERLKKILDKNPCPDGRLKGRGCQGCEYYPPSECYLDRMASHLIRNGVWVGKPDGDLISRKKLHAKLTRMRLPPNIYIRLCKAVDDLPSEEELLDEHMEGMEVE